MVGIFTKKRCLLLAYDTAADFPGFPNLVGHNNSKDLDKDLSLFREVMDGECYALASNLLCKLLQPECEPKTQQKVRRAASKFSIRRN